MSSQQSFIVRNHVVDGISLFVVIFKYILWLNITLNML